MQLESKGAIFQLVSLASHLCPPYLSRQSARSKFSGSCVQLVLNRATTILGFLRQLASFA